MKFLLLPKKQLNDWLRLFLAMLLIGATLSLCLPAITSLGDVVTSEWQKMEQSVDNPANYY